MTQPVALPEALASLTQPVQFFIDHGLFYHGAAKDDGGYSKHDIPEAQVRRIARHVAQELKRPFIVCSEIYRYREYDSVTYSRLKSDKPVWGHGYIEIPKRKALAMLATPLLLAASEKTGNRWATPRQGAAVIEVSRQTLWAFTVCSRELWDEYKSFLMNDNDARAARKAPLLAA